MKKISIVIPVYNSENCLEELVQRISSAVKKYELILVNDCSPDGSWEVIKKISAKNKNVKGVNLLKNKGQDNALMAGLHHATREYVVIMDDDLQHDPSDIPKLYKQITKGFDVCYANLSKKKQSLWKNVGSWLNGKVAEIIINKPEKVYLSPYKIMTRQLADEIINYNGPYPYVDGLIFRLTNLITQVEIDHHERFAGSSGYNLSRSIRVFLKLATSFSVIPLRISSFLGFIISILAIMLGVFFIVEYFVFGIQVTGWTTLTLLILFFGGMIMISLGMIGEYIGRMYMLLNNSPQFTIRETCGYGFDKKNI
jgi:glycosyltransferase involved in cell wall biosynthesis